MDLPISTGNIKDWEKDLYNIVLANQCDQIFSMDWWNQHFDSSQEVSKIKLTHYSQD